jgi:hypothetical protein
MAVRIGVGLCGAALVVWTLMSALKTVVVPRAMSMVLTRVFFVTLRRMFRLVAGPRRSYEHRDRIMALFAPLGLVLLPGLWVALVITGFTAIFWATGVEPVTEAFTTSGSSLLTLGFVRPEGAGRIVLAFIEAGLGLGIVSLMISYLPTIYSAFSRREALVGMLEVRAGLPPSPAELLTRFQRIEWLGRLGDDVFERWERWFIDVEESHTSHPALAFFRSPHPGRSWITAAGCVLDTAALAASTLDLPRDARREVMLRTGFFALRRISDYYGIDYDPDPAPTDPISVTRDEFDDLCAQLQAMDIPLKGDLDQAWRDFAGWRVNYDTVLVTLCGLVMAPPAIWSSDRDGAAFRHVRIRRSRRDRVRLRARR